MITKKRQARRVRGGAGCGAGLDCGGARGGMLDEGQTREIAELAARADEHIVGVYSGRVETI